eukprot:g74697.t1
MTPKLHSWFVMLLVTLFFMLGSVGFRQEEGEMKKRSAHDKTDVLRRVKFESGPLAMAGYYWEHTSDK